MTEAEMTVDPQPKKMEPVQAGERLEFVDILRGFALLGVITANMAGYSGMERDIQSWSEPIDKAIPLLIRFFVEAKFYSLFSFLFGWGMAIQMERASVRGGKFLRIYLKRLGILFIIGLIHAFFLWPGDILATYAVIGCLLLLFRKRSPTTLLVAAGLSLLFAIAVTLPGSTMDAVRSWYENATSFMRSNTYPLSLYGTGTYWEITRLRVQEYLNGSSWFIFWIGNIFAMFLLGLYVGKRRIFQNIGQRLTLVRVVLVVGLVVGVIFNGLYVLITVKPELVPAEYVRLATRGSRTIGAPALMLFYVTGIILLVRREEWQRRLAPLGGVGRGALSNYLMQSVVCTLIFYGYGLGLYGKIDPLLGLILTGAIFMAQIQLSAFWFGRFRFGPAEWLWRTLTYGRIQPMRLKEASAGQPPWLAERARQAAAKIDPKLTLVIVWTVLIIWAAVLGGWYLNLEQQSALAEASAPTVKAPTTAVPTSIQAGEEQADSPPQTEVQTQATPVVQPVDYAPGPIAATGDLWALTQAFDVESALDQIEILSAAPFSGRYTGSPQAWAAGDYIAAEFARYGLQPAGDDGTFFQSFPVEYITLEAGTSLHIQGPDGALYDEYQLFEDISPVIRWYSGAGSADGEVIWANDCTVDDFRQVEALDKVVLCRADAIQRAERNALEHGAAGVLFLTDPAQRPPDFGNTYFEPWVPEPLPALRVFPSAVDELLLGSGKTVEDLSISFEPFALETRARLDVQTSGPETCPLQGCQGRNVLGVLPGRDPRFADQVIVLGAHYDHIGQAPNGIVWPGANDDASGVAVLLELARTWHEQGYVPRHTVVFAAWDAEEVGLIGSSHYVQHPRYPLEDTVGMIQLDMVGAGNDTLWIDGGGDLGSHLEAVASALGWETELSSFGRSDHVPFMAAGVSANLLIWSFDQGEIEYHRPSDTPEAIQIEKLEAVGQIASLTVLGLTEGDPAIEDVLARRASAAERGDLAAFLDTSLPEQEGTDRTWFNDLQGLAPQRVEMRAEGLRILGRTATATVHTTIHPPQGQSDSDASPQTFSLAARFVHDGQGWQWAGPDLVTSGEHAGFAVSYPADKEETAGNDMADLGMAAAKQYAQIAGVLGLPQEIDATLLLFPDKEALRASTALSLPPSRDTWVEPGRLKLTYRPEISASQQLTDALAQLLLAEAGIPEEAAPWLWRGLPLALRYQKDPSEAHSQYLFGLEVALQGEMVELIDQTGWAAVDYYREQAGWMGLGKAIVELGATCRDGLCITGHGLDQALASALGMDATQFEAAWQGHWRQRLTAAREGIESILLARSQGLAEGDRAAFLATIDGSVPYLLAEEQSWFDTLTGWSPERISYSGQPRSLLDDGSLLVDITLEFALPRSEGSSREYSISQEVLLTEDGGRFRWAGLPLETLQGEGAKVLYVQGREEQAQVVLDQAETLYPQIAARLGLNAPDAITLKLYDDSERIRAETLTTPDAAVPIWGAPGESIRLVPSPEATVQEITSALALHLPRYLLAEAGVNAEWLLKGVSLYLSQEFDGGLAASSATKCLIKMGQAQAKDGLYDLTAMPADHALAEKEAGLARAQSWDTIRYLVLSHGWEALAGFLQGQTEGLAMADAMNQATGQSLEAFEASWAESLARAHAEPEWIETANAFEPGGTLAHIEFLSGPELEGRRAGTPGSEVAAAYIAEQFANVGLQPAGDPENNYFQALPVSHRSLLSAPRLEIVLDNGSAREPFVYREDFVLPEGVPGAGGPVTGELVWINDPDQGGMDLAGKIAVWQMRDSPAVDANRAMEQGADGLILVGGKTSDKEILAKSPLPGSEASIPVLELTQKGFERLLEILNVSQPRDLEAAPASALGLEALLEVAIGAPKVVETANVLGLLPGFDPVLGQEIIIIGAHYDHVGDDPDGLLCTAAIVGAGEDAAQAACEPVEGRRYAGANDNASGIGIMLEIARLWQETGYQPKRSILFAAWGAQEAGQIGSKHFVKEPTVPLEQTVAMLQLDAVGGGAGYYLEAQGGGDREGLHLFSLATAEEWVDGRLALKAQWAESDQIAFREAGIPTLLITWRDASERNWPVGLADEVDPYRLGITGRVLSLALMTLAR